MKTDLLMTTREIPKHRGTVFIVAGVLIGLVLARFLIISPAAALVILSCGIVIAVTVFVRRTDYLIYAWFILTSLIWFVMVRLLPPSYYEFVGRGIFWGLLVCIIVTWAIDNIINGRQFVPFDNLPMKATILVFVLWAAMSLFTSIDALNSIKKLSHIVIALIASYMFYDFFSRDQNNIRKVIGVLFFVVIVISFVTTLVALYALLSGTPIYKKISLWFWNPNSLGNLLFMSVPILIAAGLDFVSNKSIKVFFVSIMLLALFCSFHRTSWLAFLVSIIFLLWRGRLKIPVWTAIIIGLLVAAFLFPVVGEEAYNFITGEQYTGRMEIWQGAYDAAREYPVFGVGPGNVLKVLPEYIVTPWLKNQNTHSVYLRNAAEMGFMSVAVMLAVYVAFFCSSWRIEKNLKSDYLRSVTRGATATFLGLIIHGIFENGSFMTPFDAAEFTVLMPYILMAMPFAAKKLEERQEDVRP